MATETPQDTTEMDIHAYNRKAWNRLVESQNRWTVPVTTEEIRRARTGDWQIVLTPSRPIPRNWFPDLPGLVVLCLASGGGQQGPLLAAAGAAVTVVDASPRQLEQDRAVAEREGLLLETVDGDMADLSMFAEGAFDLLVHPCSNCFVPDIRPVWRECFRVLRPGGILLAGFVNPVRYIFDEEHAEKGELEVRHSIPYSDLTDLDEIARQRRILDREQPLEFGHSLEDQIGGQLDAGFVVTGFYEDRYDQGEADPLSAYLPTFCATRAVKNRLEGLLKPAEKGGQAAVEGSAVRNGRLATLIEGPEVAAGTPGVARITPRPKESA